MRLIDADALLHELNNSHYPGAPYIDAGISIAIGKVCDAPTIGITAECEGCQYEMSKNYLHCEYCMRRFADKYEPVTSEEVWDYA